MTTATEGLLPEALRLAELGWHVFALGPTGYPLSNCRACDPGRDNICPLPDDKAKCDCLTCHGFHAATTDPERLAAMWDYAPRALIGVATGRVSGLVVLDFDAHPGGADGLAVFDEMCEAGALPATVAAKTGGGGRHLLYATPDGVELAGRNPWVPGVDVKANGGFIIAAPSAKRDKRAYRWATGCAPWERPLAPLPDELRAAFVRRPEAVRGLRDVSSADFGPKAMFHLQVALDVLALTENGGRNRALFRAACRAGDAVSARAITEAQAVELLREAALEAGMTSCDGVDGTIRSGLNSGQH